MRFLLATMMLLLMVACASAESVFTWEMTDMNGVTGFKLYCGSAPRTYDKITLTVPLANAGCVAGTPTLCTFITNALPNGTWLFAATAIYGAEESTFSNEVTGTVKGNPQNMKKTR